MATTSSPPSPAWPLPDAQGTVASKPLNQLVSSLECTVYGDGPPALNQHGTRDPCVHEPGPAFFAPVRGSCHVSAVPDGAAALPPWLCSLLLRLPGSPLPRAICLKLRCPGGTLFYLPGRVRPDGQASRFGAIHVRDPSSPALPRRRPSPPSPARTA